MTSTTSDRTTRRPFGLASTTWAIVAAFVIGMVTAGLAVGFAVRDRDAARDEADAVSGQSQQLVDCVRDPATSQGECEKKADEVEETLDDVKAGDPGEDGAPGEDGVDGQDGADGVDGQDGARGPQGPAGRRGPRGVGGAVGPIGPAGADGQDGADGVNGQDGQPGEPGADGQPGPRGEPGPKGEQGEPGTDGAPGADGKDGRGIQSTACDPETEQFVVTYTDGTSEPVEGSDCIADLLDP